MVSDRTPRSFGTHDGRFHADEVTACAALLLADVIDRDKIVRTRDPKLLATCEFVCDVGGVFSPQDKLFDHHQADYTGPMSSAGMILRYLFERGNFDHALFVHLNEELVAAVDAHDNGRDWLEGVTTFSRVIDQFNPIAYDVSPQEEQEAFFEAVDFALGHLRRMKARFEYNLSCRETIHDAMKQGGACLVFEKSLPWQDAFFEFGGEAHPALFVIMPMRGHWKLRGIPPNPHERMKVRKPLPEEWAGLLDEDLKQKTGIPGAIFCHKGRFISVWETKEDALVALSKVLEHR